MQYRGMVKWTQMVIPQHMEMIAEYKKEISKEMKPLLDDQLLEDIHYKLLGNMESGTRSKINCWGDGKSFEIEGVIRKVKLNEGTMQIVNGDGYSSVRLEDILGIADAET